jgi:hypothetical protein
MPQALRRGPLAKLSVALRFVRNQALSFDHWVDTLTVVQRRSTEWRNILDHAMPRHGNCSNTRLFAQG